MPPQSIRDSLTDVYTTIKDLKTELKTTPSIVSDIPLGEARHDSNGIAEPTIMAGRVEQRQEKARRLPVENVQEERQIWRSPGCVPHVTATVSE